MREQLNLTVGHLEPEYQDALWEKDLDSFNGNERYGRELERREAIEERYRSPPRRDKSRIAGTNYTGPHRAAHKVAARVEVSAAEENEVPESGRNTRKGNRERIKEPDEQVAAAKNRVHSGPSGAWGARIAPTIDPEQSRSRRGENSPFQSAGPVLVVAA